MKNEIMRLAEAMAVAMAGEKDAVALIEARAALEAAAEKLTAERDEYAACADTMAAAHKVERDDLSARYETASRLVTSLSDALAKALKERDALKAELARPESTVVSLMRAENAALKGAARLALDALENIPTAFGNIAYTKDVQEAIAALKAVL